LQQVYFRRIPGKFPETGQNVYRQNSVFRGGFEGILEYFAPEHIFLARNRRYVYYCVQYTSRPTRIP
jgi:hypothetical protein